MVNPVKNILGGGYRDPGCYADPALKGRKSGGCKYWKTFDDVEWPDWSREAQVILDDDRRQGVRSFVTHQGRKHHMYRDWKIL